MGLTIPLGKILLMYISLRGFLIFCYVVFLLTLSVVYWDVLQRGNYAKSLGTQGIAFMAMIILGALAIWKFRKT
jgi:hypothetical protein